MLLGHLKVDGEYYRNVLIVVLILQLKPQQHVPYFITFASDGGDDWEEDDNNDGNPCPPNTGLSVWDGDNLREILKDYVCN